MSGRVAKSTWVALGYVVLGFGCIGILAILINAVWAGSLTRLWQEMRYGSSAFLPIVMAMIANFLVAGIIYRYQQRGRTIRLLGLGIALGLFAVHFIGTVQGLMLWHRRALPAVVDPEVVWMRAIQAFMYGLLAYEVIRIARASNNRWRGP